MWYKLKRIMMRPNGVEKQVRPSWWKPWANCIAYFPFIDDKSNTISGSNISISNSNIWITTLGGVECLELDWVSTQTLNIGFTVANITSVMCWVNSWNDFWYLISERSTVWGDQSRWLWLYYNQMHVNRYQNAGWDLDYSFNFGTWWNCVGYTEDSNWWKLFLNGNLSPVSSNNNTRHFNILTNNVWIFCNNNNGTLQDPGKWYASKLVLMDAPITIDDFLDFYNQTKSDYWL